MVHGWSADVAINVYLGSKEPLTTGTARPLGDTLGNGTESTVVVCHLMLRTVGYPCAGRPRLSLSNSRKVPFNKSKQEQRIDGCLGPFGLAPNNPARVPGLIPGPQARSYEDSCRYQTQPAAQGRPICDAPAGRYRGSTAMVMMMMTGLHCCSRRIDRTRARRRRRRGWRQELESTCWRFK